MTAAEEHALMDLCIFAAWIYVKAWFTVPLEISAVCNDLQLLKSLMLPYQKLNLKNFPAILVSNTRKFCTGFAHQSGQLVYKMAYIGSRGKGRQ